MSTKRLKLATVDETRRKAEIASAKQHLRRVFVDAVVDFMAANPSINYFGIRSPVEMKIDLMDITEDQFINFQTELLQKYLSCYKYKSVRVKICGKEKIVHLASNGNNLLSEEKPFLRLFWQYYYAYSSFVKDMPSVKSVIPSKRSSDNKDGLVVFADENLVKVVFNDIPVFDKNGNDVSVVEILEVVL